MADAATCEVRRTQLWMWLKYKVKLDDGRVVDEKLIDELIEDELNKTKQRVGEKTFNIIPFTEASKIFKKMITKENFDDFLTLSLYEEI